MTLTCQIRTDCLQIKQKVAYHNIRTTYCYLGSVYVSLFMYSVYQRNEIIVLIFNMVVKRFAGFIACACAMFSVLPFYDVTLALLEDDTDGKNCSDPCNYQGQVFCGHIPCPLPRCDRPLVLTPGDCCEHCPEGKS